MRPRTPRFVAESLFGTVNEVARAIHLHPDGVPPCSEISPVQDFGRMAGRRAARRVLATVLFTDIVGSTERTAELGNRRWRQLLVRHHELVRRLLKRYGGREVDTAGDGFFAVFNDPGQAVACACTIVDAVKRLGIEIRAGLHVGECEVADRKVAGMAVHIGARVLAAAGSSEVLVSGTVRDLLTGSDLRFDDRGSRALKGVPGDWRLFAARLTGPPSQEELDELAASKATRLRRWAIPVSAVAAALVAGLVSLLVLKPGGAPASLPGPTPSRLAKPEVGRVVRVDPASSTVLQEIPVGRSPTAVEFGEGSAWVANRGDNTVSRIDPATGKVTVIHVGKSPEAIAVGDLGVWITNTSVPAFAVQKIDPATNRVVKTISLEDRPSGIAEGESDVWVVMAVPSQVVVLRIDASTGTQTGKTEIPAFIALPAVIVTGSGFVLVGGTQGILWRVDPSSMKVVWTKHLGKPIGGLSVQGGSVWVATGGTPGMVFHVDTTDGKVLSRISAGGALADTADLVQIHLATDGLNVWVTDERNRSVSRIITVSGDVQAPIDVGATPTGVAAGEGSVWVTVGLPCTTTYGSCR
jgi:YVTN family beta-propeller protein